MPDLIRNFTPKNFGQGPDPSPPLWTMSKVMQLFSIQKTVPNLLIESRNLSRDKPVGTGIYCREGLSQVVHLFF